MKYLLNPRSARSALALVFAVALISSFFVMSSVTAFAAPAVSQCNGTDNVGGQAVECSYTVTNTINGDVTSSSVTLTECHGAANDPPTMVCSSSTETSTDLVTSVDQCNGSGNGGGGTVECSVDVINNITGTVTPTSATVNQCNASGTGGGTAPTVLCDPFPANTSGATVTQCNESGNGGGGTMRVRCTVGSSSTTTSLLTVTINQCNGSGNGGGATVTCRTSLTDNVTAAPAPQPTETTPPPSTPAPNATDTPDENEAGPSGGGGGGGSTVSGSPGTDTSLETGQVTRVPVGGAAAGGGSTSGTENVPLVPIGMVLVAAGLGVLFRRRFGLTSHQI